MMRCLGKSVALYKLNGYKSPVRMREAAELLDQWSCLWYASNVQVSQFHPLICKDLCTAWAGGRA
jgi:hypothetical protein